MKTGSDRIATKDLPRLTNLSIHFVSSLFDASTLRLINRINSQHIYIMPLRRTLTLANLNDENQSEKNNPLSFPPADPPDVIESNNSLTADRPPLAVLVQPYTRVCPSTTTSLPRKSSPLGPHPYLLLGQPLFPPSVRKPDLYRQALKKSARQVIHKAKRHHICRMEKKKLGGLV